ncbi:tyrosine-protein phosphatase [Paenibacillus sp. J2TS4]|uniref:tyrosine-protein phosphatase n=1 Tax=Paenibacillus sp. J2TS4 TaxID=2807194 RepID=UPI001B1CE061|nr:CpsB/CapC family capsule biosynthesis tyrosine phosphatase [Paenibacillus sp. J2TS4]GIP34761.1 tyrosine protein phosphatase [Paenibacillus sp. J2TS4]
MIDIHCHILDGVDDGASDLRESIAMAKVAHEDGVRHIVATPHFNTVYHVPKSITYHKVRQLQDALQEAGIPLTVSCGHEVTLKDAEQFYKQTENNEYFHLNEEKTFLLLEQPWAGYMPDSLEVIDYLIANGVTPIIPHPERHVFFREEPKLLTGLIERGAWTQVSADSLAGRNNEDARRLALWLLENDLVHTLGSDAHNIRRKPNLGEGYQIIVEHAGEARQHEIIQRMALIIPEDGSSNKNPVTA